MAASPEINYPQYRRYKTGTSWFCIQSPTQYEEIRKMGSRWFIDRYEAKILPDRNWIYDLTFAFDSFADEIPEKEYMETASEAQSGLQL